MGLRRTKRNENNATIFHSYPCSFLSVFPLSVAIFVGSSPWAYGAPGGMKITPPFFIPIRVPSHPCFHYQ